MYTARRDINWPVVLAIGAALSVALSVGTPDTDSENIGNWFFAKTFFEDFKFITRSKAPLYQVYLSLFTWLPYPAVMVVERIVSTFLCFVAVAWLMGSLFDWRVGLFALVLTAPDVLMAVPYAQAFAFALTCIALTIRIRDPFPRTSAISASYALLLTAAFLLRSNYLFALLVVLAWDVWNVWHANAWREVIAKARPMHRHWTLIAVGLAILVVVANQSPQRWNNYHLIDKTWINYSGQVSNTLSQAISLYYREQHPEVSGDKFDLYFMHEKLFGNAETTIDMVRANPVIFIKHFARNLRAMVTTGVAMTGLGQTAYSFTTYDRTSYKQTAETLGKLDHRIVSVAGAFVLGPMFLFMAYRFRLTRDRREALVFFLGLAATTMIGGILVMGWSQRLLYGFYGIYMLMAAFYIEWSLDRFKGSVRWSWAGPLLAGVVALSLSQGGWARNQGGWARLPRDLIKIDQVTLGEIFFAGQRTNLYPVIDTNWQRCHGMMVYPHPFQVAAFSTIPEERLYTTYEIPPFGKLGDPAYNGLREDRINCVYMFGQIRPGARGGVTNISTRRKNYIDPYVKWLQAQGAETIRLDSGILVILDRGKTEK